MTDAHLIVSTWIDTNKTFTNEWGETYQKQVTARESIYCRVKSYIHSYRWVRAE